MVTKCDQKAVESKEMKPAIKAIVVNRIQGAVQNGSSYADCRHEDL